MDHYDVNPNYFRPSLVEEVASRFLGGDVGILPTETVYGLMCCLHNRVGLERIYQMKRRDTRKKLQIMIPSLRDAANLNVSPSQNLEALAIEFWPGPLTIVVRDNSGKQIALRVPNNKFLLSVLREMKQALVATSANVSGGEPSKSLSTNFRDLLSPPDFVVLGKEKSGQPSTVIRLSNSDVELIREGEIPMASIEEVMESNR